MKKVDNLEHLVRTSYESKDTGRDEWADWMYENHVFVVDGYARELAERLGLDEELVRAGAMLHDIADTRLARKDPNHELQSLDIARQFMAEAGYDQEEIALVVDDGLRFHSCRGDERPRSREGQALAAADALGHLKSDFYVYAAWALGRTKSYPELKQWAREKVERDFRVKLSFFPEVQQTAARDYELLRELFLR